jgi:hypothetical protein
LNQTVAPDFDPRYPERLARRGRKKVETVMTWSAVEFENWRSAVVNPEKRKRAWEDLSSDQKKQVKELRTFLDFYRAAKLDVDPRTIQNREVPEPDILCELSQSGHYFELGELTDQSIPALEAEARRDGNDIYGGKASLSDPLEKMIYQKCAKTYLLNGMPVSLLLHFSVPHQVPCHSFVRAYLAESRGRILAALNASPFWKIWFFDCWTNKVLTVIERDQPIPASESCAALADGQTGGTGQRVN